MKPLGAFLFACSLLAPPPQEGQGSNRLKLPLTPGAFRKGQFRPGYDFQTDPPLKAWTTTVGKEVFHFFDMDEDGALTVEKDGLAIPGAPFVVPIPDVLLTRAGQFDVAFSETTRLELTPHDLGRWQSVAQETALLATLRIQAGVRPARFDSKASSDCEKHCDYIKLNGGSGMSLHDEDPKKKGYTPEGAVAGKGSDIDPRSTDAKSSIMGWYQSVWHRAPMVRSNLRTFGFAIKHGIGLLYFFERSGGGERDQLHPPDGAIGAPITFDPAGEMPNPVPGSDYGKGCGFPVIALLRDTQAELTKATVTDPSGRPVKGTQSCPVRHANPQWPSNSGCAAFIPAKPLSMNATYKARFEFKNSAPLEWSFATGR